MYQNMKGTRPTKSEKLTAQRHFPVWSDQHNLMVVFSGNAENQHLGHEIGHLPRGEIQYGQHQLANQLTRCVQLGQLRARLLDAGLAEVYPDLVRGLAGPGEVFNLHYPADADVYFIEVFVDNLRHDAATAAVEPERCSARRLASSQTSRTDTSAGLTPPIRAACPSVSGRMRFSFSRASLARLSKCK